MFFKLLKEKEGPRTHDTEELLVSTRCCLIYNFLIIRSNILDVRDRAK